MTRFFRRLWSGCWFWSSHDFVNGREGETLVRHCTNCRLNYPILATPIVRGPRSTQIPDLGTVRTKAMPSGRTKVSSIAQSSRRA